MNLLETENYINFNIIIILLLFIHRFHPDWGHCHWCACVSSSSDRDFPCYPQKMVSNENQTILKVNINFNININSGIM